MGGGSVAADAVDQDVHIVAWTSCPGVSDRVRRVAETIGGQLTIVADRPEPTVFDDGVEVLVVDEASPDWLGVVARITERRPEVRPLLIGDVESPDEFLSALSAGVVGFCPCDASVEALERSIRSIVRSGVAIPRSFTAPLVEAAKHGRGHIVSTAAGDVSVTDREWEILQMLVQRRSTREMSTALYVSVGTVRSHVSALMKKLGAVDREDVIALIERGRGDSSNP